ncbi:hypothetical protein BDV32DRAFT_105869 [Aspergillus pseudonomiae]|nr:hypothetical protein BDV32DRAFT_105869 [Aspergillus pseudonomiae]
MVDICHLNSPVKLDLYPVPSQDGILNICSVVLIFQWSALQNPFIHSLSGDCNKRSQKNRQKCNEMQRPLPEQRSPSFTPRYHQ